MTEKGAFQDKKPGYFREGRIAAKSVLVWLIVWLLCAVVLFSFSVEQVSFRGRSLVLPRLTVFKSFSNQFFETIKDKLVPKEVDLIVTNPVSAFLAQVVVAFAGGFVLSFPVFLYKLLGYLFPALHRKEKRIFFIILIPAVMLFGGGVAFAYYILIPPTFEFLYSFAGAIGASSYFTARSFVFLTLGFSIGAGVMFLTPIVMVLLVRFGLVEPDTWIKGWRYALIALLVFSALVTGPSAVSMIILALPMIVLYFAGYLFSRWKFF